jgi:hypothetical protein
MKLFYELGFERTYEHIKRLQKEIFNSESPQNPFKDLSTWIFPCAGEYGLYYSMLCLPKDSINYSIDVAVKIISYLIRNFDNLIKEQNVMIYDLDYFIGKNIKFVGAGSNNPLLPNEMYDHIIIDFEFIKKYQFLGGMCNSIPENFTCFDKDTQQRILRVVSMEDFGPFYYLCNYLGVYLGSHYSTLDRNLQETLLTIIQTSNKEFSKRLIWTLAVRYSTMDEKFQEKILEIIGQRVELLDLGVYVIADFASFDKELFAWTSLGFSFKQEREYSL